MNFYLIEENYLNFLRKDESKIMYGGTNYKSNSKFTIGVVLTINGINYYAPMSSIKPEQLITPLTLKKQYKQTCIPIIVDHDGTNVIAGTIRLDFMFPAPDTEIHKLIFSNIQDYNKRIFLQKQYVYATSIIDEVETKANEVYNKAVHPAHYLHKKCCNFKLLEVKHQEWIKAKNKK